MGEGGPKNCIIGETRMESLDAPFHVLPNRTHKAWMLGLSVSLLAGRNSHQPSQKVIISLAYDGEEACGSAE